MAQENGHLKKLAAARERMIHDRRALADALASDYKGGHTEQMGDNFIIAQNAIEAIDRAMAHEALIARERPDPSWLRSCWSVRPLAICRVKLR